jgi:predicted DNA-binding antitoxin AbrB/MazE fold protein
MFREIRARFSQGKIEPSEELELEEGEEVVITVQKFRKPSEAKGAIERTAGAWKGTLDFDAYLEDLYRARRSQGREFTL